MNLSCHVLGLCSASLLTLGCNDVVDHSAADAAAVDGSGHYEAFTVASRAIAIDELSNYALVVVASDAPLPAGCSLTDDHAHPGQPVKMAFAKFETHTGGTRCPAGVYSIQNSSSAACDDAFVGLRPGCAVYKRWNNAGVEEAKLLATGGSAQVTATTLPSGLTHCAVFIQLAFPGANSWSQTFSIDYDPLLPDRQLCIPAT